MLALDAQRSLALTLEASVRRAGTPAIERLERLGLTVTDALALAGLAEADGASVQELAGRLRVPRRSVAAAIARLSALGGVEREGDEVWLTGKGRVLRRRLGRPYGIA